LIVSDFNSRSNASRHVVFISDSSLFLRARFFRNSFDFLEVEVNQIRFFLASGVGSDIFFSPFVTLDFARIFA
jgi:hypothetical protein